MSKIREGLNFLFFLSSVPIRLLNTRCYYLGKHLICETKLLELAS